MILKNLEISGFKSFAKKTNLSFEAPITAVVGPNGSGKSNVAEALRWVLGEQSLKSLRGKKGEDLIFGGSQGATRMSRASVSITFDNKDKTFDMDFPEVSVEREVHRDGSNYYSINGSQVRLRDIIELLSQVSLGPSGHHIIRQGEADRVLNANPRERREILEDALGLKIYQFKKAEAGKRLEKTNENLQQVASLRREIAPHLKFLKKQVEEIERGAAMREELLALSRTYFVNERAYLGESRDKLNNERQSLTEKLGNEEGELSSLEQKSSPSSEYQESKELDNKRRDLGQLSVDRGELERRLGRIEGALETKDTLADYVVVNQETGEEMCRYCGQHIVEKTSNTVKSVELDEKHKHLESEKVEIENKIKELEGREENLKSEIESLEEATHMSADRVRESERKLYELKTAVNNTKNELDKLSLRIGGIDREEEIYNEALSEISILIGHNLHSDVDNASAPDNASASELRKEQESNKKQIDRLKIKIEDLGGGGEDVLREYEDTQARDKHLEGEVEDLENSAKSLRELMDELDVELAQKFKSGLSQVNKEFQVFFSALFSGGNASLDVLNLAKRKEKVEIDGEVLESDEGEDEKEEIGIEIKVSLPRKKIKGLEMLSGGERALTSIALIFAMSQVNPPPFLVLDETDAALDEANSRRYGDMIEKLAKKSQLVLITHNRETMSRAGVLYGVTMGADSISKLLSIKFDDATAYAK